MFRFFVLALFFYASSAQAVELSEADAASGRFHFFTAKCEIEHEESVETTPQSPPLNVDDPGTPGCNRWEINFTFDGDITPGNSNWELPLLDLNYGIGDNLQLKYEVPHETNFNGGGSTTVLGESKVGVKWMFFEDEGSKTQIAFYPQRTIVDPNSEAVKDGFATTGAIAVLPILLTTKVGKTENGDVSLTADFGYNISTKPDLSDFLAEGVGVGFAATRKLALLAELYSTQSVNVQPGDDFDRLLLANIGFFRPLNANWIFYGSIGHSLYTSDSVGHSYVLLGFRLLAGPGDFAHGDALFFQTE